MTAWAEILTRVISEPNIVEFDLKGFFDSVRLTKVAEVLRRRGLPDHLVELLDKLNTSAPKLPKKRLMDESNAELKKVLETLGSFITLGEEKLRKGVPQGAPTSPLLATQVLGDVIFAKWKAVMYADDGIIYGDKTSPNPAHFSLESVLEMNTGDSGVEIHPAKSGWIKRNGEWLKPLLFLGLEYDGKHNTLRSRTRKMRAKESPGLEYDRDLLVRSEIIRRGGIGTDLLAGPEAVEFVPELRQDSPPSEVAEIIHKAQKAAPAARPGEKGYDTTTSAFFSLATRWDELIASKLTGYMWSRLYMGSWSLADYLQDFRLSPVPGS